MRGDKWDSSVLRKVKKYTADAKNPSVSGLSEHLGVSRQCIYDWANSHKSFHMALNLMKHRAISDDYVPVKPKPRGKPKPPPEPVFEDELGSDEEWEIDF